MQRIDLPALLWRLIDPVTSTTTDGAGAPSGLPPWQVGQLLTGQVLENLDGQVLVLIDGHRLRAHWPGASPAPGAQVELQVVGQVRGQWHLALVKGSAGGANVGPAPASSLLAMLDQLDWPLTYNNVERLARSFAGHSSLLATDGFATTAETGELCPPNLQVWQQLFGWEPGLLSAVFFTWQPFVCGLFVEEEGQGPVGEQEEMDPLSFLFVVDLPRLGQVEVLGRGRWPEQTIVFVARKETALLLQKKEAELIALLSGTGMELRGLVVRPSELPLVKLLRPEMVPYRGLNQRL